MLFGCSAGRFFQKKFLKFLIGGQLRYKYCVGFCHPSPWISHRYTYVPSLLNLLPPYPSSLPQSSRFQLPESYSEFPLAICVIYGSVYGSMMQAPFCRLRISRSLAMQEKVWKGSWVDATLCPVATPLYQVQVPAQSRDKWYSNISLPPTHPKMLSEHVRWTGYAVCSSQRDGGCRVHVICVCFYFSFFQWLLPNLAGLVLVFWYVVFWVAAHTKGRREWPWFTVTVDR